jgi:hypothetical protein
MGLRESIIGRMRRHGGQAEIRTAPGEGTEVRLTARRVAVKQNTKQEQESEEEPSGGEHGGPERVVAEP